MEWGLCMTGMQGLPAMGAFLQSRHCLITVEAPWTFRAPSVLGVIIVSIAHLYRFTWAWKFHCSHHLGVVSVEPCAWTYAF